MPGVQRWSQWGFLFSPHWLAWHLFIAASAAGMIWLCDWQLHRALAGNSLSWAYTFEWPFFAVLAVVFWGKTIHDEAHPPATSGAVAEDVPLPVGAGAAAAGATAAGGEPAPEDEELAAYNAYLARLHQQVKGHGKWHGWR
jgi:hypothetical protein